MSNFFSRLADRFRNCSCFNGACRFVTESDPDIEAVKLPWFRLIYMPFALLFDYARPFFALGGIYIMLLSILSWLMGYAYICSVPSHGDFFCRSGDYFLLYAVLKFALIFLFAVKWYRLALAHQPYSLKDIFLPNAGEAKGMGVLSVFLLLNLLPLVSLYLLVIRVPNPDWVVEIIYFGFVSIGFLVPFMAMRFYSLLGFAVMGEKMPSLRDIWNRSAGNMLRLLVAMFFIFILALFVLVNFNLSMRGYTGEDALYVGITSEVVYNMVLLLLVALFVNHCYIQKLFLFGDETNASGH